MRALVPLLASIALATPALAQTSPDAGGVTILRGASAPPPPPEPRTVVQERTVVEYRYLPAYTPVYFLPAPFIVHRHHRR